MTEHQSVVVPWASNTDVFFFDAHTVSFGAGRVMHPPQQSLQKFGDDGISCYTLILEAKPVFLPVLFFLPKLNKRWVEVQVKITTQTET